MRSHALSTARVASLVAAAVLLLAGPPLIAQTRPQPPRRPAPAQPKPPQTKPPQPSAPAPAAAAKPAPPPAPAPQDVQFRATYTTGDTKTEAATYIKGERERFEFGDMILLKQHDLKRTVQISKAANTYMVVPDGQPLTPAVAGAAPPPPRPAGVVLVTTTIADTGERKTMFGRPARHVRVTIDRQPMAGACDTTKQHIETDGWYIDAPMQLAGAAVRGSEQPVAAGCADSIQATNNGDPSVLGFPIAYTTTIAGQDGAPISASMEVTAYEMTTLDAPLFEIPPGLDAAGDIRQLSKALSDANEVKLAAASAEAPPAVPPKVAGVLRIGVPEFTNKTAQAVDTRALRQRLIADLTEAKVDAVPMAAGTPAELQQRARQWGYDYVLFADVTELKASKPGALGGLMKAAGGIAGGRGGVAGAAAGVAGSAAAPKENTESTIAVKLVQPDGKQRLSSNYKGKDGSGFSLQTGLGLAKFAGGMYLSMMGGPLLMARLNGLGAGSLNGMGLLGNPAIYQMQMQSGGLGKGMGLDATAGAASYLVQTAMTMNDLGGYVGVPGQGPSFDESLGEAVQNAAKGVQKSLSK